VGGGVGGGRGGGATLGVGWVSGVGGDGGWGEGVEGEREKWVVNEFAGLTDEVLRAVRQDRLNAAGFSRDLHELTLRPPPLTSGVCMSGRGRAGSRR